ncbi:MAG: hypothetical protein HN348_14315 [Proteobacteria bacterium]|jgi:hypothetical protein|nr:hypothetical protein [Pseudomonadota bacterium]
MRRTIFHAFALLALVAACAFWFANVEIQIEGGAGWASSLPVTFRIEEHWLLDIFWGGRAMTGYHAWVFSFMAIVFHLPIAFGGKWSVKLEARVLSSLSLFWIIEDATWFIVNPAFGWAKLTPADVPWHVHWFLGLPTDYWTFGLVGGAFFAWSFTSGRWPLKEATTGVPREIQG